MRRGEVWWADMPPPHGTRPVLLLMRNDAYDIRDQVILTPITTRVRGLSTEVSLGQEEGLPRLCVANLDTLATVDKDCVREYLGTLSPEKMRQVNDALRFALGMER